MSMRPLAEALAGAGLAVELPRLPGHGTSVDDMLLTGWDDWRAEADRALEVLRGRTQGGRQVVVGLSMGGALTAAAAEDHPDLAGVVLINTPIAISAEMAQGLEELLAGGMEVMDGIGGDVADPAGDEGSYDGTPLRPLLSLITAGAEVRSRLGEVIAPALIITSRQDHVVNPEDSDVLAAELGGPVERLWLEKSFHVATVDYDKAEVEAAAVAFATRVTSG
jgi:carboxylesterase